MVDIEHHSRKIFNSKEKMDRRLIYAYQTKRWREDYKLNSGKSHAFKLIQEDHFVKQMTGNKQKVQAEPG